jgi:phage FluMu protein Com
MEKKESSNPRVDYRCRCCKKLLFKVENRGSQPEAIMVEVKCGKCGEVNQIDI